MAKKQRMMSTSKPGVRLGLLGLGTVGQGVCEVLRRNASEIEARVGARLEVVRAVVRSTRKKRVRVPGVTLTQNAAAVVGADDIDVVVEVAGGIEPARSWVLDAVAAGQSVVTANKSLMAACGREIMRASRRTAAQVYYEAAIAGGIPIVRTLRDGMVQEPVQRLTGILNGTSNFILDTMQQGESYAQALKMAQQEGYAEADPSRDVGGMDAADKLALLIQLAFGTQVLPDAIETQGIEALTPQLLDDARALGCKVRSLACAERFELRGKPVLRAMVAPFLVPSSDGLSAVRGVQNAIEIESDFLGTSTFYGPGAGALPTGSAVVADIIDAARDCVYRTASGAQAMPLWTRRRAQPRYVRVQGWTLPCYWQLQVQDKPGVLAALASVLARHRISIATMQQRARAAGTASLRVTTHPAAWADSRKAYRAMQQLGCLQAEPQLLPIYGEL